MKTLKTGCELKLEDKEGEGNSGLGKAIRYFLKHYLKLIAFCVISGAQIDNNLAERMIKIIARGRKNAMFFKTLAGAHVGDVITSLIAACELNGVNCYDYLVSLQQNRLAVRKTPAQWMPWNYQMALEELALIAA